MQSAGDLVASFSNLPPACRTVSTTSAARLARLVHVDGNAASVVDDGDRVVAVDRDVDLIAVPGQRLVDGVVDDFVHEMVQPGRPGRSDVHRRPLPDGFEPFEDLDLVRAVLCRSSCPHAAHPRRSVARRSAVQSETPSALSLTVASA